MTNKPMLSIERELIEKALRDALTIRFDTDSHVTKLRALLDKPAENIPDKTVDAFSAWYSKNHYGDMSRATVGLMAFKAGAAYAESAAQHQGEPVAWLAKRKDSNIFELADPAEKANNPQYWTDSFPVYADQPAPVAVVMPERESFDIDDWAGSFCQEGLSFGVNQDCFARCIRTTIDRTLAEVARLNGVKP